MFCQTQSMEKITVMLDLDTATLRALQTEARISGEDIGNLVRIAIRHDLYRRTVEKTVSAKSAPNQNRIAS